MSITVVGDCLLDEDIDGTITRLCPDAPAPVLDVATRRTRAGGAGLAARLLRDDGHDVVLVTALARDPAGARLESELRGIRVAAGRLPGPTPVKTRVRSGDHTVCRVDDGGSELAQPQAVGPMISAIDRATALLVSDYGRGVTAHPAIRAALERRAAAGVPLVWDPHPRGPVPVPGTRLATPNLREAMLATGAESNDDDGDPAAAAGRALLAGTGSEAVLVTRGADGALLVVDYDAPQRIEVAAVATTDPCGAGDRLAASAIVALAAGASLAEASRLAVAAAAAFLRGGGVTSLADASALVPAPRAVEHDAVRLAQGVRARGGTVVAAGGCFDLLHAGHVRTLETARAMGDCLIVCMNADESVRRLKGPDRPIVNERDRAELLRALVCVDAVLVFAEDTPERALDALRPDVWVKGGDYTVESLPESRQLAEWGGRAVTLPFQLGRSTTRLAQALANVS